MTGREHHVIPVREVAPGAWITSGGKAFQIVEASNDLAGTNVMARMMVREAGTNDHFVWHGDGNGKAALMYFTLADNEAMECGECE